MVPELHLLDHLSHTVQVRVIEPIEVQDDGRCQFRQNLASSLGLYVLFDETLGRALLFHPLICICGHITLQDDAYQSIKIPENIAVHPLGVVRLIARSASSAGVARIGPWEGPVEVYEGDLEGLVQVQDNIFRLEVTMHEA